VAVQPPPAAVLAQNEARCRPQHPSIREDT
jgi:hypothetical protein